MVKACLSLNDRFDQSNHGISNKNREYWTIGIRTGLCFRAGRAEPVPVPVGQPGQSGLYHGRVHTRQDLRQGNAAAFSSVAFSRIFAI